MKVDDAGQDVGEVCTFRLSLYQPPSGLTNDRDELLDIRETCLGHDLSEDEYCLQSSLARADDLSAWKQDIDECLIKQSRVEEPAPSPEFGD